jgi:lipopolysaccharide/colanic/teichoic acid biosynthesis glycosyltransferase
MKKRVFDFLAATLLLTLLFWLIAILWVCASFDTRSNGIYIQKRVGLGGRLFNIYKIKSMRDVRVVNNWHITDIQSGRLTKFGLWMREFKLDELPQLWNVIKGDMSFVGPRPDVESVVNLHPNITMPILAVRPGITGPASILYKNEEQILADVENKVDYYLNVIYPEKVRIDTEYILSKPGLIMDIKIMWRTIFS